MSTKYDHTDWFRLARTGGVIKVTLDFYGDGQGNDGVSLPCRGCFVQRRDPSDIWITSVAGMEESIGPWIPGASAGCHPIWIPISDVSQLYFSGSANGIVDIVYLLG